VVKNEIGGSVEGATTDTWTSGPQVMIVQKTTSDAKLLAPKASDPLRIAALALRALLIGILVVVMAHVSSPQSETIWSAYETPGDLIRLALGLIACLWILFHFFKLPKDATAHRTWIYLGLVAVPFALICAIAVW